MADELESDGHPRPAVHGGSESSFEELLDRDDVDLVYIATPWEFHYPQGRAALLAGKHVGVELPIALELDHLWDLVDTSEQTRKHLWLMENCSYGRNELAMLKMAHEGVFGDITNGHGGYEHDLRALLFSDTYYTDAWRRKWHTRKDASFYPMHGLAPIAACMDINRGDRMLTLAATSSAPRGLDDYRERFIPPGHPSWQETYVKGDHTTCMITTHGGRIIRAEHDVSSPRPYSRINSLAGSRGLVEDYVPVGDAGRASTSSRTTAATPGATSRRTATSTTTGCGRRSVPTPTTRAGMAASTTSCSGGSSSRCGPAWCRTSRSTTPRPGARRYR